MTSTVSRDAHELRAVAEELAPLKSLERMADRARTTVSTVNVVGAVVTGLGVLTLGRLPRAGLQRGLIASGGTLTLIALLLALSYLVVTVRDVNRRDLADVGRWLQHESRRTRVVVWASRLLLAGATLTALVAVPALWGTDMEGDVLAVGLTPGTAPKVSFSVHLDHAAGGRYEVKLTSPGAPGVLHAAQLVVDGTGQASVDGTVNAPAGVRQVSLEVRRGDDLLGTATAAL